MYQVHRTWYLKQIWKHKSHTISELKRSVEDTVGDRNCVSVSRHIGVNSAIEFPEPRKGRHTKPHDECLVLETIRDISYFCRPVRGLANIPTVHSWGITKYSVSIRVPGYVSCVNAEHRSIGVFNIVNSICKNKSTCSRVNVLNFFATTTSSTNTSLFQENRLLLIDISPV